MRGMVAAPGARTLLKVGSLLAVALLLGGCLIPPEPETTEAKATFGLYVIVLIMAAVVFVGVEGFILYSVFRYRRRDDRLPAQLHGNNLVEVIWTVIPTVIVVVLFVLSISTLGTVQATTDKPAVVVEVDGFQWQWTFRYRDDDNNPDNDYSVTGSAAQPPVMGLPVGVPIRLLLHSQDVIHSFYVPHFLIKKDLIPEPEGQAENQLEFTITEAGTYAGQCAEFCGNEHAAMRFTIQAMSQADFDTWIAAGRAGESPPPPAPSGAAVVDLSAANIAFDTDSIQAPAGQPFVIRFKNDDGVQHDVAIYNGRTELFNGDVVERRQAASTTRCRRSRPATYRLPLHDPPDDDRQGRRAVAHRSEKSMATTTLTPQTESYRRSWVLDWLTTVDHKKIGIMYIVNSFVFFFAAGMLALAHPLRAGRARAPVPRRADLQPGLHDARHDHDLPVRGADAVGLRELHRAAPARRAGHGLPAHQRAQLLVAAARRAADLLRLPLRRRGGGGLDRCTRRSQRRDATRPGSAPTCG